MKDYLVSCCSTVDLDADKMEELNLPYLSYRYELDGVLYEDDFGKSVSSKDFYQKMRAGADTKTAGLNVTDYEEFFRKLLKRGTDLLHITMSSGISGSYQAACIAAKEIQEEFPDQKVEIIDSLCICGGYGLLMEEVVRRKNTGEGFEELKTWILENRLRVRHWFFSSDLTFYIKGGRISKLSGIVGGIFEICPLMDVNREGKLVPRIRVRTKKKVIQEIVSKMKANVENDISYRLPVLLHHSDCIDDCLQVKNLILNTFPNINELPVYSIGTTIGSHSGPGTVALFFWGTERTE